MRKQPTSRKERRHQTSALRGWKKFLSGTQKSVAAKIGRVAAVLVAGLALLCGCYCVGAKASKPYVISYRESKDIAVIRKQIAEAEAENKSLKSQIGYLKTDRGKIVEARKLGFVRNGEISIVVGKPEDCEDSADRAPAKRSVWTNVKDHASSALHRVKSLL